MKAVAPVVQAVAGMEVEDLDLLYTEKAWVDEEEVVVVVVGGGRGGGEGLQVAAMNQHSDFAYVLALPFVHSYLEWVDQ